MYLGDARIWLRTSYTGGMKKPRRRRGGAKSRVLRRLAHTCRQRGYRGLPASSTASGVGPVHRRRCSSRKRFSMLKCIRTSLRRHCSASRNLWSVAAGSQVFMPKTTISRSRMRAASSLAWRSASVGRGDCGRLRTATGRAPSRCRQLRRGDRACRGCLRQCPTLALQRPRPPRLRKLEHGTTSLIVRLAKPSFRSSTRMKMSRFCAFRR
jgi:hypothetical protein